MSKEIGHDNTLTNTMNPILFNMVQCEKEETNTEVSNGQTKPTTNSKPKQSKKSNTKHIITIDTSQV